MIRGQNPHPDQNPSGQNSQIFLDGTESPRILKKKIYFVLYWIFILSFILGTF